MRRMILHRYVFFELAGPTLLGLLVFTFILLATHLFRLTDLLLNRNLELPLFLSFVSTLLPPFLILTAPMALLVGVLLGVGRLAADNEIMAMRTSGVHLVGVFTPVFVAAVILTGLLWAANRSWVPGLMDMNRQLLNLIRYRVASSIEPGRMIAPPSDTDVALYYQRRNPLTWRMEGLTLKVVVRDAKDGGEKTQILATSREGHIETDSNRGEMQVILSDGTLHNLDSATTAPDYRYVVAAFDELRWRVDMEAGERRTRKSPEQSSAYLAERIRTGQSEIGRPIDRKKIDAMAAELHQRRSIPLACVAFALLGVPLAIRVRPTGKAIAFSIAFGLIFFYYVMLKWGVSLSQNGSAAGAVVVFLPNILVGGVGVFLLFRILRQ